MRRHLINLAAFAFGVLVSFILLLPSAYAAPLPMAGPGSSSVSNNVFRSGPGAPSTTYTVDYSVAKDITSTATDITVSRNTPFSSRNRFGDIAKGTIIDAIKVTKSGIRPSLIGAMRGGLLSLGMTLLSDYAIQKGFEWMDSAKQYYTQPSTTPSGQPQVGNYMDSRDSTLVKQYCGTSYYNSSSDWINVWGLVEYRGSPYTPGYYLNCFNTGSPYTPGYYKPTGSVYLGSTAPACPSGYIFSSNTCARVKGPATDADLGKFIDDVLSNFPDKAIRDMITAGIPADYTEQPTKSLAAPVITLPRTLENTTTHNPDGSTTTKQKTNTTETKIAPTGDLSQTDKTAESTTTKDPAGNTTSSSNSNTDSQPELAPDVSDPDMPTVPTLYTQKYPNGLQGVWDAKKTALQNTAFMQSIAQLAPSGWNTGTCPVWTLDMNIGRFANYGNSSLPFPCWIVPFLKAAVLLTAAFTARKLIWG